MDAPPAGARHGRGVPGAVSIVSVAGRDSAALARAALDHFRRRRALGVVGWWMVSSGLSGTLVKVSQYRLAFHLTLACAIYAAILWTAQQIAPPPPDEPPRRLRFTALAIAGLLLVQIYFGALLAGLDGGLKYNTWPLIDGGIVPPLDEILFIKPLWRNVFENILTVQFDHRMLADGIWLLAVLHAFDAWRMRRDVRGAFVLAGAVTLQAALGIVTLLYQAPLALALAHQVMALIVFSIAIVHAERCRTACSQACRRRWGRRRDRRRDQ